MKELIEWLNANKMCYCEVDDDVIEIVGFGKVFFEDTDNVKSILKKTKDGDVVFNASEHPDVLINEGINYSAFKFGNNFYFTDLRKEFELNILKYVGEKVEPRHNFQYANLGIHTPYELLNGSFLIKDWVNKAKFCGHQGIGICDKNTMAAHYNLQKVCEENGIKYVFGYSFDFIVNDIKVGAKIYVQTQQGLQNLLRVQKAIMVDSQDATIKFDDLLEFGDGNVLVLDKYSSYWIKDNVDHLIYLQERFIDVFFQIDLSEYKAERFDIKVLESAKFYFDEIYQNEKYDLPPILLTDCYYLDKSDAKNKILLNKISEGAAHEQSDDQYYKDIDEHYSIFEQLFDSCKWDVEDIFSECCENTMYILENANARFDNTKNFMPKYDLTEEERKKYGSVHNMFNEIIEDGFKRLVPTGKEDVYRKQVEHEKYIIESTDNIDYLLVQYDTCNWARKNGILVGCGRGSAAGSLLLYLLGITLIDPLKYNLIFERFLLPERAGLYSADTTIISPDVLSDNFVEVVLENEKKINIDKDAELIVKRESDKEPIIIYADELKSGDDILFDNRDVLFTINEL